MKKFIAAILVAIAAAAIAFFFSSDYGQSLGALSTGRHFENSPPAKTLALDQTWPVLKEWIFGKEERVPRNPLPIWSGERPQREFQLTWLGHSTVLIELDGVRILTDPQFSERASPSTLVGPRRFHPPPLPLDQLGHLDAVLISHDHYDHLDMRTVQALAKTGVRFIVPRAVGAHLQKWGVENYAELDWWQKVELPHGAEIALVPARHFSGRLRRNDTLWGSYAIIGPKHRVFFSGDTGPHQQFAEIAQRFGPFEVAMIEIGQYHSSWGEIHLGPRGAFEAFRQLGARKLLPIHWATFELAMHSWNGPAEDLWQLAGARQKDILTPLLGEPIDPSQWQPRKPWWETPQ